MGISYGEKLFIYYDENKIPKHGRYSYFGNDFGSVTGFNQYIDGYILAVKFLFEKYSSCKEFRMDILDTIVYPLCFNYRHIVELYIKYFYFKYSKTNDAEKEIFIEKVSHRLNKAWKKTRPFLQPLLYKINNPIDIMLFNDFINQIDAFDTDSFRMRYPIKKNLSSVHTGPVKLDVVGLHHKMMQLFDLFHRLDAEIDAVLIDNTCREGFIDIMSALYRESKTDIITVVEKLRILAKKENDRKRTDSKTDSVIDISDIDVSTDKDSEDFEKVVLMLPQKHAAMLALLIHAGQDIDSGKCRLAFEQKERKKDFMKLLEMRLDECNAFISLDGTFSNRDMCYALLEKSPEVPLKWLERSITIINCCVMLS